MYNAEEDGAIAQSPLITFFIRENVFTIKYLNIFISAFLLKVDLFLFRDLPNSNTTW